jgi:hypothetical protein
MLHHRRTPKYYGGGMILWPGSNNRGINL